MKTSPVEPAWNLTWNWCRPNHCTKELPPIGGGLHYHAAIYAAKHVRMRLGHTWELQLAPKGHFRPFDKQSRKLDHMPVNCQRLLTDVLFFIFPSGRILLWLVVQKGYASDCNGTKHNLFTLCTGRNAFFRAGTANQATANLKRTWHIKRPAVRQPHQHCCNWSQQ